jgi:rhamnosyltransferase
MVKHMEKEQQHIFLVGAKSLGAYGGYETFVNKLTEYHQNDNQLVYHVACKANGDGCMDETKLENVSNLQKNEKGDVVSFTYHNAHCFKITVPNIGPAQAIYYDLEALNQCCHYIEENHIQHPIVYIMACRIGPFASHFYKKIHKLGGKVYLNPDGHEWMRAKWSAPIRKYWKISEQMMIKYCDLAICDSINIEKYIHESYDGKGIHQSNPNTTFIAYGAETKKSEMSDDDPQLQHWYDEKQLRAGNYYLVVGRFVPENNFETMIREFMASDSTRDFAIITTANEAFLEQLEKKLQFRKDKRIKFVGTVYNQELLKKIRENAYGYFHGHEVGGTNPSLLEALGSTSLNLLLNVGFNQEVAQNTALYWDKSEGSLANLIHEADHMNKQEIEFMANQAKERIKTAYSWEFISGEYKKVFLLDKLRN